jgi:FAD/FMN-containing dehydrogenase
VGLVEELRAVAGRPHVVTDPDVLASYGRDWTGRWARRPRVAVRPATTDDVAAVLSACAAHGAPVVPQGGNTSLVGGSVPASDDSAVVLSTARLDHVGEVEPDAAGGQVVAGAGVTVAALHRLAHARGLTYGVDLASRDSATVGGTVATNAGGLRVCRYGDTASQVQGLQAALADGTVLTWMSGLRKDGAGYRLPQALVGSEGTLAVVTAARLRLHRAERRGLPMMIGCDSMRAAQQHLHQVADDADRPLQLAEVWDEASMSLLQQQTRLPHPLTQRWPWYVLLATRPLAADPDGIPDVAAPGGSAGDDLDAAADERLGEYRDRLTEAMATLPHLLKMDVAVPPERLPAFADDVRKALLPSRVLAFGHLAESNLHLNISVAVPAGTSSAEEASGAADEREAETAALVARLVVGHGGTIASEHGVGQAKAGLFVGTADAAEVALTRSLKAAFDPAGVLNPGVILPVT